MKPESLDEMMRAVVELKEEDILLLGQICRDYDLHKRSDIDPFMFEKMFELWRELRSSHKNSESACRGSLARLQAHGLLYAWYGGGYGSSTQYELLDEGRRFYEYLQEIGAN